ncbi:dysbindin domain-containing protein 2 isoform X2 [Carettochelys insculpta]|uniref:dysbindin domain-containing protein 2 isoform X2 n=1 Tax=Carettochelys insculpta TaxID=44489 RepID=UPI003EC0ED9C
MSGAGAPSQSRRPPADMEQGQRGLEPEQTQQQQLKLRDRQKFFEEVFQHEVDFFFPMSHLQIEHRRPPLGSISSMEVNVDMLEQVDMTDLSDQDAMDVFLGCGTEDSSVPGQPDLNSLDTSEEGAETPVVQSDEEEPQEDRPEAQAAMS